jgi:hypothetical protein
MWALFRRCGMFVFLLYVRTVPTVWYVCISIACWDCSESVICLFFYCMLELRKTNIPHRRNSSKIQYKYKHTTPSEQFHHRIEKQTYYTVEQFQHTIEIQTLLYVWTVRRCGMFVFLFYVGIVPTVWYVCFSIVCSELFRWYGMFVFILYVWTVFQHTIEIQTYNTVEQFQHSIEKQKYHTVGTVPIYNRKTNIPHCRNSSNIQ